MLGQAAFVILSDADVAAPSLLAPQDVNVTHEGNLVGLAGFEPATFRLRRTLYG